MPPCLLVSLVKVMQKPGGSARGIIFVAGLSDEEQRLQEAARQLQLGSIAGEDASVQPGCKLCGIITPPPAAESTSVCYDGNEQAIGRQSTVHRILHHQSAAEAALRAGAPCHMLDSGSVTFQKVAVLSESSMLCRKCSCCIGFSAVHFRLVPFDRR